MIILDNLINNYIGIQTYFIILSIFNFNKNKFFILFIIDIILNKVPYISIIILFIFYLNKYIYKFIYKNKITMYILSLLNLFIFILLIYIIKNNNVSLMLFLKNNIIGFVFSIIYYAIYIFFL